MAKNRFAYAAILLMVIIFIGLNDSPAVYTALYAVLLIPVTSFILTLFLFSAKKNLHISEKLSAATLKKGENAQYFLTVSNTGRFTFRNIKAVLRKDNRIIASDCEAKSLLLPARGSCEMEFELRGKRRGVFNVGASEIWLYDPLCLFRFRKKITGGLTLTVLPDAIPLPMLPLAADVFASAHIESGRVRLPEEDPSEITGLRAYIPGDGHKRVHWKLSAKKNTMISKTYRVTPENSAVLIVDNSKFAKSSAAASDCEDKIIEALVSAAAYCAAENYHMNLRYMGNETGLQSRRFEDLYAAAAGIEFNAEGDFSEFFSGAAYNNRNGSNIFIFTHRLTDLFCGAAKSLLPRHNVVIFYCPPEKRSDERRRIESLRASGAVFYSLSDKINIADAVMNCE